MSLADELEAKLRSVNFARDRNSHSTRQIFSGELGEFVEANQDAILSALRGRDAVLEEAALACEEYRGEQVMSKYAKMSECQAARSAAEQCGKIIRAMKENKQ